MSYEDGGLIKFDLRGYAYESSAEIDAMYSPVRCGRCGKTYDLGAVTVTERYADCSVWKAPCCGVTTDDREWTYPQYQRIERHR